MNGATLIPEMRISAGSVRDRRDVQEAIRILPSIR